MVPLLHRAAITNMNMRRLDVLITFFMCRYGVPTMHPLEMNPRVLRPMSYLRFCRASLTRDSDVRHSRIE